MRTREPRSSLSDHPSDAPSNVAPSLTATMTAAEPPSTTPSSSAMATSTSAPELLALPGRFMIERAHGALSIRWRWRSIPIAVFLTLMAIVWDGLVVLGLVSESMPLAFLFVHGGTGLVLSYLTLAQWLNSTQIEVAHGVVLVRHGPLPWAGHREVPVRSIEQLCVVTHDSSEGARTFRLQARLRSGEQLILVDAMKSAEQARALERAVEEHLGIVDHLVDGEHRPAS